MYFTYLTISRPYSHLKYFKKAIILAKYDKDMILDNNNKMNVRSINGGCGRDDESLQSSTRLKKRSYDSYVPFTYYNYITNKPYSRRILGSNNSFHL